VKRAGELLQIATPFVWFGMILAISGLETPLKFRAPGVTRALGLGIGRLVFRALNIAELVLLAVLTVALIVGPFRAPTGVMVFALWMVMLVQTFGLRPRLDRRAQLILDGGAPPRSSLHFFYIALEGLKIVSLPVLGILLTGPLLA
jgi:hypothetical protein